jgi:two-component system OmpR family response regulator
MRRSLCCTSSPPGDAQYFLLRRTFDNPFLRGRESPDESVTATTTTRVLRDALPISELQCGAVKPAVDTSSSRPPSQARRQLRVLVVDDERDTVLTLMELLRDEGHETHGVYKSSDALAAMKDFDPDVVLLDIAMPGMSGWEVAREIRSSYGEKRPLLVALSGVYKQSADQILGKLAGFNYYIAKPYDPGVLLTLLHGGQA